MKLVSSYLPLFLTSQDLVLESSSIRVQRTFSYCIIKPNAQINTVQRREHEKSSHTHTQTANCTAVSSHCIQPDMWMTYARLSAIASINESLCTLNPVLNTSLASLALLPYLCSTTISPPNDLFSRTAPPIRLERENGRNRRHENVQRCADVDGDGRRCLMLLAFVFLVGGGGEDPRLRLWR